MSPRLVTLPDVATIVARNIGRTWAERICQNLYGEKEMPIHVSLRPGISSQAGVLGVTIPAWNVWRREWEKIEFSNIPGVLVEHREITVAGVKSKTVYRITVRSLASALSLVEQFCPSVSTEEYYRARNLAVSLFGLGVQLNSRVLKRACRLDDNDVLVLCTAIEWFGQHKDLGEWTATQLPIPDMDTKWLRRNLSLLSELTGRDLQRELLPRPSVVHVTYVDPSYLATGQRHHDAWTSGDNYQLAYKPRHVLIVENRDCRLWFPPLADTIVVEGDGKAAASLLANIDWLKDAENVVYWGDLDCDGFIILNHVRGAMLERGINVVSILMDEKALDEYEHLGVSRDKAGKPLSAYPIPSSSLTNLYVEEAGCYDRLATTGSLVRRIEQERIPMEDALAKLESIVSTANVSG